MEKNLKQQKKKKNPENIQNCLTEFFFTIVSICSFWILLNVTPSFSVTVSIPSWNFSIFFPGLPKNWRNERKDGRWGKERGLWPRKRLWHSKEPRKNKLKQQWRRILADRWFRIRWRAGEEKDMFLDELQNQLWWSLPHYIKGRGK